MYPNHIATKEIMNIARRLCDLPIEKIEEKTSIFDIIFKVLGLKK
jgi:hypothetical protein